MTQRNWNTDNILPASSDELDRLIAECKNADEVKAVCLAYAEKQGTIVRNPDGIGGRITGKPDPDGRTFSAVVTVRGRRMVLTGARSQQELDAQIAALESQQ